MKKGVREEILLGMAAKKIQTEWLTQHSPRGPWDVWYNLPIHEWWDVFVYGKCVIYRYINIPTMSHFPLDAGIFFPRGFGPSTGSPCQVGMPRTSYPALRFARWWFQIFCIFTPTWGNDPFWLIFLKWVETTNQLNLSTLRILPLKNWLFWRPKNTPASFKPFHWRVQGFLGQLFLSLSKDIPGFLRTAIWWFGSYLEDHPS